MRLSQPALRFPCENPTPPISELSGSARQRFRGADRPHGRTLCVASDCFNMKIQDRLRFRHAGAARGDSPGPGDQLTPPQEEEVGAASRWAPGYASGFACGTVKPFKGPSEAPGSPTGGRGGTAAGTDPQEQGQKAPPLPSGSTRRPRFRFRPECDSDPRGCPWKRGAGNGCEIVCRLR